MERHRLKQPACRSPHRGIVVCLVTPCLSALSWANATPTATPTLQPPTPAASATFRPNFQPLEINGAEDTRVLLIGTGRSYQVDVPEGLGLPSYRGKHPKGSLPHDILRGHRSRRRPHHIHVRQRREGIFGTARFPRASTEAGPLVYQRQSRCIRTLSVPLHGNRIHDSGSWA